MVSKVGVVIVNYNCEKYVEECILSIEKQDYKDFFIVVVDNGSTDKSVEKLKLLKFVKILFIQENRGFAAANNIGIEYALKNGAEYILLLNMDTKADKNLITQLVKYADENTVTAPFIYTSLERGAVYYTGGVIDWNNLTVYHNQYDIEMRDVCETSYVSACCMLINRKIIETVGYLCEDYFMYYEDVDFFIRMKLAGVKFVYVPKTRLYHANGGSRKEYCGYTSADYYLCRNKLIVSEKFHKLIPCVDPLSLIRMMIVENRNKKIRQYSKVNVCNIEKKAISDYLSGKFGELVPLSLKVDFQMFFDEESAIENGISHTWRIAAEPYGSIIINNNACENMSVNVEFRLLPICKDQILDIDIYVDGQFFKKYTQDDNEIVYYNSNMRALSKRTISFLVHNEPCTNVNGDYRKMYFSLADYKVLSKGFI